MFFQQRGRCKSNTGGTCHCGGTGEEQEGAASSSRRICPCHGAGVSFRDPRATPLPRRDIFRRRRRRRRQKAHAYGRFPDACRGPERHQAPADAHGRVRYPRCRRPRRRPRPHQASAYADGRLRYPSRRRRQAAPYTYGCLRHPCAGRRIARPPLRRREPQTPRGGRKPSPRREGQRLPGGEVVRPAGIPPGGIGG